MFREGISQGGADATGGAYLEVNGVGVHVADLIELEGQTIGGAQIHVFPGDASWPTGMLDIFGVELQNIELAGVDLQLDNICTFVETGNIFIPSIDRPTIDFEDLDNTRYDIGQGFRLMETTHNLNLKW